VQEEKERKEDEHEMGVDARKPRQIMMMFLCIKIMLASKMRRTQRHLML
jgi:hypothetical protein